MNRAHCLPVSAIENCRKAKGWNDLQGRARGLLNGFARRGVTLSGEESRSPAESETWRVRDNPRHYEAVRPVSERRRRMQTADGNTSLPLVTVITAVFNGERFLAGCIESVLNQTYPNLEHIVLDGGSSDGTIDILRKYNDRIAFWKSEPDRGIYDAWNKGLREAQGDWICFLGADDEFLPDAISTYMDLAKENPSAEFLSSRIQISYSTGNKRTVGEPWKWRRFSRFMCSCHVGSMHRRSLFDRLGKYDISYRTVADYEFLLRARHQLNAAFTPAVTVMMRGEGVSSTRGALNEQARAKILAGGRNRFLAAMELQMANAKYLVRPLRHVLARLRIK
jgi:glycosyltransferase involved in cell wall biosynthesis